MRAGELVAPGPYSVIKRPLYTAVALLVLPWLGFLLDSWLGAALGVVMYVGSRLFAPDERRRSLTGFGGESERSRRGVKIRRL